MKLSKEKIREIAEELDCGMKVYVNKKTLEIKTVLDFDAHFDADTELWEEDINEIEENYDDYLEIEKKDSNDAYQVMEDFIETIEDTELKRELELGLNLSNPFRNFKDIIDSSGQYRDRWFEYKNDRYIKYVEEQLLTYNQTLE